MATGQTLYSDIADITVGDIYEAAILTLHQQNVLGRTVKIFRDTTGMNPRNNSQYSEGNPRAVAEGVDVIATKFAPSALATLTPARIVDQVFLTDQEMATAPQDTASDAALEMGMAFAAKVDDSISDLFSSLTGGTVGAAGSTLTWTHILNAYALMETNKVPKPYFCALHPYQYLDLTIASAVSGAGFHYSPAFMNKLAGRYLVSDALPGCTFVITSSIEADGDDDGYGAMYSPMAMAYDERKAFNIRPQRDESREGMELNYSAWYATGVWVAARGVAILSDMQSNPSS